MLFRLTQSSRIWCQRSDESLPMSDRRVVAPLRRVKTFQATQERHFAQRFQADIPVADCKAGERVA